MPMYDSRTTTTATRNADWGCHAITDGPGRVSIHLFLNVSPSTGDVGAGVGLRFRPPPDRPSLWNETSFPLILDVGDRDVEEVAATAMVLEF